MFEFLKDYLQDDEAYKVASERLKKEIGMQFIPKAEYNKKSEQLKTLQEQLEQASRQNASNSGADGAQTSGNVQSGITEAAKEIERMKAEFEQFKLQTEREMQAARTKQILKDQFHNMGIKSDIGDLLLNVVNLEEVTEDNQTEVIEGLKTKYSTLFEVRENKGSSPLPNNTQTPPPTVATLEDAIREKFTGGNK